MSKLGVTRAQDFWDNSTQVVKDFKGKLQRIRGITPELGTLTRQLLIAIQSVASTCGKTDPNPDLWIWTTGDHLAGTFVLQNKISYQMILPGLDAWIVANTCWTRTNAEEAWLARWRFLWRSDLTQHAKIFMWRITMHGLYTKERARTLGHGNGSCQVYTVRLRDTWCGSKCIMN